VSADSGKIGGDTFISTKSVNTKKKNKRRKRQIEGPADAYTDGGGARIRLLHEDLIGDAFWHERPYLLE
jgi:hypothetical protein